MESITLTQKDIDRFWSKVDVRTPNECWEWKNKLDKKGYGYFQMTMPNPLGRKNPRAHRVSWVIKYGVIPKGMCVLHECDNRRCENPNHLFLGTYDDNNKDRNRKGRTAKGEHASRASLTNNDVIKVKEFLKKGFTHREIGKMFGVSHVAIGNIQRGTTWKHLSNL